MCSSDAEPERTSLRELATLFLKLGTIAFGGPAAHVAMMRREVVERLGWLDERRFLDLLAAANVIPGPTSTELAIHIGYERGRLPGLIVAGVAFIVPAMLITGLCGWLYVTYGTLPDVRGVLYGVAPVVVAIVADALRGLLPRAASSWPLRGLGVVALTALWAGLDELTVLFGCGALAALVAGARGAGRAPAVLLLPTTMLPSIAAAATPVSASGLFFVFTKIGSVLFGSGYVLLAFLRAELVERLGWLTETQLVDAVAVGQVTPGPVFTTATFLGFVLGGTTGALASTVGIFLPAFVFVALLGPLVPRLRRRPMFAALLDGVTVASLALMAAVTLELARSTVVDATTVGVLLAAWIVLTSSRIGPTWLIVGGAAIGWLLHDPR
ncbi:MAG: chromate efflux transporter [Planctomycetota bacterium]